MAGAIRIGRLSTGSGGAGIVAGGIWSFFSYRIFISALFFSSRHSLFTSPLTPQPPIKIETGFAGTGPHVYVHRTFLALKSNPLKTRLDLIHKQANDHVALVNAYAAYARKLKLKNSKPLRVFEDLARNFSDLILRPSYRAVMFEMDSAIDEDVLRQFEKEVKNKVKLARQLILEAKESFDNQFKIQKLKDNFCCQ